ncbi:hypothetical protein [Actinocorallia sp. A-T 12471]|uniref:aggregation-promoting factor C-terminal-like domain-containing protein n=1 Tax=Actinocorallia sp. A-T 12471 TaxID=3089813 RepID=UPI0029CC01FD|nr:hypothetical protein [Actinocorallia sp. A-T 12471]MDX6738586.1 hypothetical protein [Actinocorallia sp. A-T 12471]
MNERTQQSHSPTRSRVRRVTVTLAASAALLAPALPAVAAEGAPRPSGYQRDDADRRKDRADEPRRASAHKPRLIQDAEPQSGPRVTKPRNAGPRAVGSPKDHDRHIYDFYDHQRDFYGRDDYDKYDDKYDRDKHDDYDDYDRDDDGWGGPPRDHGKPPVKDHGKDHGRDHGKKDKGDKPRSGKPHVKKPRHKHHKPRRKLTRVQHNKLLGWRMVDRYGWKRARQWPCLRNLWARESGWSHRAHNSGSGAHGIPQALPGGKMASAGRDWATNPKTQIKWGLRYIKSRYGSPCAAWAHFGARNWY